MATKDGQKTIPTLYKLSSSGAHRVHWALEEINSTSGLTYHVKPYSRWGRDTPKELKAVFPLGKSPIMTLENIDNTPPKIYQILPDTLTEARLILQFVADNYSNGIWVPDSEEDKARDIFFQEFANSTLLAKTSSVLLFEVIPQMLPFPFRQLLLLMISPIRSHFMKDQVVCYQILEDALSDERPWFAGRKIGLADFNMSFGMDMAVQRGYFEREKYPKLAKWHETTNNRPAYKKALEEGGNYNLAKFT